MGKENKKAIFFLFKEAGAEARCAMNHFIIHEERRKKSEADSTLRECLRGLNSEFPSAHQSAKTNIDASLLLVIVRSVKIV